MGLLQKGRTETPGSGADQAAPAFPPARCRCLCHCRMEVMPKGRACALVRDNWPNPEPGELPCPGGSS